MDSAPKPPVHGFGAVHEADPAETLFGMAGKGGGVVERPEAQPLLPDPLDIDIGDGQRRLAQEAVGLGDRLAQFVDQSLTVPGQVGRAFADSARADCAAASIARSRALPMTMFEADRLQQMVAPASAPSVEGGVGAQ